jgi:hypothetical protein
MFCRIRTTHSQFQGRASHFGGLSARAKTPYLPGASEYMIDLNGYGTHVAGTIGGYQFGVAPYANIINVKAFDINRKGNLFLIMEAIDDIITDFAERKRVFDGSTDWQFRGGIINMSWGMKDRSAQLEVVAKRAKQAGMLLIAAAGNAAQDSQDWLPCNLQSSVCVGAVRADYSFDSDFSNYGAWVEFLAPGDKIKSAGHRSDQDVAILTGTSMAAPHAAGAAAIFTSWLGLTSAQVGQYLWWNCKENFVSGNLRGSTNHLINTGIHAPEKYGSEPFRWAHEKPIKDHAYNEVLIADDNIVPTSTDPYVALPTDAMSGDDALPWLTLAAAPAGETTDTAVNQMETAAFDVDTATSTSDKPSATSQPSGGAGQQLALATYIDPGANPDTWNRLIGFPSDKVSVLVANVVNSPDSAANAGWIDVILRAAASGKTVLGYVRTRYLSVSFQKFTTRLGSSETSDWIAQI